MLALGPTARHPSPIVPTCGFISKMYTSVSALGPCVVPGFSRTFAYQHVRDDHFRGFHFKVKDHACDIHGCSLEFYERVNILKHVAEVHRGCKRPSRRRRTRRKSFPSPRPHLSALVRPSFYPCSRTCVRTKEVSGIARISSTCPHHKINVSIAVFSSSHVF